MVRIAVVAQHRYFLFVPLLQWAERESHEVTFFVDTESARFRDWHYWMTCWERAEPQLRALAELRDVAATDYDVFLVPSQDAAAGCPAGARIWCHDPMDPAEGPIVPCFVPRGPLRTGRNLQPSPPAVSCAPGLDAKFCTQVLVLDLDQRPDPGVVAAMAQVPGVQVTIVSPTTRFLQCRMGDQPLLKPVFVPEAPAHLALELVHKTDRVLLPQGHSDGVPEALALALAFGKPVITSGALRDAIPVLGDAVAAYDSTAPDLVAEMVRVLGVAPSLADAVAHRDRLIAGTHNAWSSKLRDVLSSPQKP